MQIIFVKTCTSALFDDNQSVNPHFPTLVSVGYVDVTD